MKAEKEQVDWELENWQGGQKQGRKLTRMMHSLAYKPGTHMALQGKPIVPLCACVYGTLHCGKQARITSYAAHHNPWLLVHQSEPKPSMQRGCLYRVLIFDLAEENTQLFFDKVRQTAAL